MGNRNIGVSDQVLQQIELFWRQPYLAISGNDAPCREIDFDDIESHDLQFVCRLRQPPERRTDPCQQFGRTEWFGDVVVGPRVQRFDLVGLSVSNTKHDDGNI